VKGAGLQSYFRSFEGIIFALLMALGSLPVWVGHHANRELSNPNGLALAREMESHLNSVSSGLLRYLEGRSDSALYQINWNGQEVHRLLEEFHDAANPNQKESLGRAEAGFERMRESTVAFLQAENAQADARSTLSKSNAALLAFLSDPMESSTLPDQLNGFAKLQALAQAGEQASRLSESFNPSATGDLPGIRSAFREALQRYEDLSRSRRSSAWADEARNRFEQSFARVRDGLELQKTKEASLQKFQAAFHDLEEALTQTTQAPFSSPAPARRPWFGRTGFCVFWMMGLLLAALALVGGLDRFLNRRVLEPLKELTLASDGAALGDLYRAPDWWSPDEVGDLSQSLNRLMGVLARSETQVYQLAALIESSADAIVSLNLQGIILSWNKGAQRLYGYSPEEMKGKPLTLLGPQEGAAFAKTLERASQGERLPALEMSLQAKNGRSVRSLIHVAAMTDSMKKIIGISFSAEEVPARLSVRDVRSIEKP